MVRTRSTRLIEYSSSQQTIKYNNTMLLFNLIRDRMPISRAGLARLCPLSASTISNLVDDLLKNEWIIETESVQASARGRRSVMLEVNARRGYVATVELLGRDFICTLYNIGLQKIAGTRVRNTLYTGATIADSLRDLLAAQRIPSCLLLGIHLIFPGVVDPVNGDLIRSTVFPSEDIIDRHMVTQLKKRYPDTHVMISSNGTIIAFEEFIKRDDVSPLPLLSLNIDEAIFGGVVLSDESELTNYCFPLEIGHTIVDCNGRLCKCANHGCLETLCATPILFRELNEKAGTRLSYSEEFGMDCNVTAMKEVAVLLERGDAAVMGVLERYAYALCCGLISVINLFHICTIRIGGDLAILGEPFLELLKKTLYTRFFPLNNLYQPQLKLFVSDYEQVRLAATIMCLDVLFREEL